VVEWITKTFVRDTAAYFFDADQRQEIQARLRSILRPGAGPYVVIAHSQGSIIAYDVLRELAEGFIEVPLLVTIGSPLGLDEVQDHLRKPLVAPPVVAEWGNFADRLDPVAADRSLGDEFRMDPPIQDVPVINRDTLRTPAAGISPRRPSGRWSAPACPMGGCRRSRSS
jgi:hypothetical protein